LLWIVTYVALYQNYGLVVLDFSLFAKYPETKSGFPSLAGLDNVAVLSSPATVVQAENLRKGLDTIVSNIGNAGGLDAALSSLASKHTARGVSADYFKVTHTTIFCYYSIGCFNFEK